VGGITNWIEGDFQEKYSPEEATQIDQRHQVALTREVAELTSRLQSKPPAQKRPPARAPKPASCPAPILRHQKPQKSRPKAPPVVYDEPSPEPEPDSASDSEDSLAPTKVAKDKEYWYGVTLGKDNRFVECTPTRKKCEPYGPRRANTSEHLLKRKPGTLSTHLMAASTAPSMATPDSRQKTPGAGYPPPEEEACQKLVSLHGGDPPAPPYTLTGKDKSVKKVDEMFGISLNVGLEEQL
jgi:hypothetical protein